MDRRQRKTRKAIYDAFEALMSKEHYSQVTVAQIIEQADIGRSTFYGHFDTKDELIDQICTEMFDHIFEGVNKDCLSHVDLETPNLEGMLAHLLYHLRDSHGGVSGKLLMEEEPHFRQYFREKLAVLIESDMPHMPQGVPADYATQLLVSSFCQTVVWWFGNACKPEPETICHWFMQFASA